ncbi:SPOSA6832_00060 [Sporobolomyces salmonicolor]|uniref:SPOSA6832_00060-mRNA-1:cds n=1 Tax=Sporidiobolus salmonicolor TaxID=5005 RepID=A0A0D6EF60_SPOSA|nr:SPOSA6832_00060 [Sporobolomyces salmonicolor]
MPSRPPLPATAHLPPTTTHPATQGQTSAAADALSVILVTGSYDGTVRFVLKLVLEVDRRTCRRSAWLPARGQNRGLRQYWEAWSGICSRTIQTQDHQPNRLAISPDKRFLAVAGVGTVKLYDIPTSAAASSANVGPLVTLTGHTANVTSLAWHAEAKWLVSGSEDGTVKIWDVRTATPQRNYAHLAPVNDLALHSNQGELISCDQNGAIKIWDLGGDCCSHELLPEEDVPMRSISIASDGSALVAGNHKGVVYVWTIQPGLTFTDLQPKTKFQAHSRYLIRVLVSPDTKQLATCSADTTIKIWTPTLSPSISAAAAADPNNLYARGGIAEGTGYQLDKVLQGHQRWVWDMAYSADSAYLVSGELPSSHSSVLSFPALRYGVDLEVRWASCAMQVTDRVHRSSASSDHTARLWELASGTTVRQYSAHHKACVCVALNDSSS